MILCLVLNRTSGREKQAFLPFNDLFFSKIILWPKKFIGHALILICLTYKLCLLKTKNQEQEF